MPISWTIGLSMRHEYIMATADRPMRLFTRLRAAERWLEGVAET